MTFDGRQLRADEASFNLDTKQLEGWSRPNPMIIAGLTNTGDSRGAAVSPDGKVVPYVLTEGGQESLWVRRVAAGRLIAAA
jgi:hypothetical protein